MNNRDAIYTAVAGALARQPFILERKETVITVATAIVWIGTTIIEHATSAPDWLAVVVGSATSLAAALTIALTRGGIPRSSLRRILDAYDMEIGKNYESPVPSASVVDDSPEVRNPFAPSPAPRHAATTRFSLYE